MTIKSTTLEIDKIIVKERKRSLSDLTSLIDSIKEVGLLNPITVNQDMVLIAGLHRLEAFKKLGKTKIPVRIIDINELLTELAEIDENIIRTELTALEKSEQLSRRKEIYEQLHPEATTKAIKESNLPKRKDCVLDNSETKVKSFTQDTAEKTGKSQRAIQQSLQIANDITPEAKEKIKGTSIENKKTALLEVAQAEPETQVQVVEELQTKKAKRNNRVNNQEKYIQLSLLDISYKVDFIKRTVAVNNKWLELPSEYDMDNNSYNNMVMVAKNYQQNKDKSAPLP